MVQATHFLNFIFILEVFKNLKNKIENGAEYIITQMFFENQKYYDFVKMCRNEGINVPIIPGVKPISTLNDVKLVPQIFHIDIPQELMKEIEKCKTVVTFLTVFSVSRAISTKCSLSLCDE